MRKKYFRSLVMVILGLSLTGGVWAQSEKKDPQAGKRKSYGFQEAGFENMGDAFRQRDEAEKRYRETVLKNNEEIIQLLKEILAELKQSNQLSQPSEK